MSSNNTGGQFGDTTYTKVFVGGLAWETQKETMKKYFEQFGEILEAVVIIEKNTGRSKGYGFVTFKEAEAAKKACVDPAPVIDGRKANCNLASLGVQRSRPSTPQHGGRNFRAGKTFSSGYQGGVGAAATFSSTPTLPHYAIQQGIPYALYAGYSPNYAYPTAYYSVSGGSGSQYLVYAAAENGNGAAANSANLYPYWQYGQGFDYQYPLHYPFIASSSAHLPQHHAPPPMSFNAIPHSQPGAVVTTALAAPSAHALAPHYPAQTNSLHPISNI
ncbi:hypothetical protein DKX38_006101 [Salix brachista]|uniref:RRM domain-containing protein n=1 Tax=Salix brachista TaxID=2182728 RepID=A0A5N5N174_9ROSI|nr:hypothetical protein DKX38_006101 [Salix brachista]